MKLQHTTTGATADATTGFSRQERLLWTIGEGKVVAEPGQQRKRARLFQIRSDFLQKSAALFLESAAFFQKSAALFLAGRHSLGKYRYRRSPQRCTRDVE